jgi:hypothetical protein
MGLPSSPTLIATQETLNGDINVSWTGPSDTGYGDSNLNLLTMYQFEATLCIVGVCRSTQKRVLSSDVDFRTRTTLLRKDMLPETAVIYSLTVLARNALGWSPASKAVQQEYK